MRGEEPQPAASSTQQPGQDGATELTVTEDSGQPRQRSQEQTAQSLIDALGGVRGMLDSGLPGVVFVATFVVTSMEPAVWAAVGVGGMLFVLRLVRRERLEHAIAGFIAVAIAAFIARQSGEATNFFLPSLAINSCYLVAFSVSLLVRFPVLGVILGPLFGEGMNWRHAPARRRAYTQATAIWLAMFIARLGVLVPIYLADKLIALGVGRLILGWPLYLLVVWLSWLVLRQTKPARPQESPQES